MGLGLVASLARPGGNATGVSSLAPELGTKRLEILKDAIPKLARVGILWWARSPYSTRGAIKGAPACGSGTEAKIGRDRDRIQSPRVWKPLFKAQGKNRSTRLQQPAGAGLFSPKRKRIVELAGKYRLAAIYSQKEFVDEGGLMSYGADYEGSFPPVRPLRG